MFIVSFVTSCGIPGGHSTHNVIVDMDMKTFSGVLLTCPVIVSDR